MSGHKRATINISQDEYDRLRTAESKLRTLPDVSHQAIQAITQQSQEKLQSSIEDFEKRQAGFEATIASMNEYIQQLESSTTQAMLAFEADTMAGVQENAGNLWDHCQQVINQHAIYFQNSITSAHLQYQGELAQYSQQVQQMTGNIAHKQEIAQEWYEAAEKFCQFVEENYQHEMHMPGRIERLKRDLDQVADNMQAGFAEAVIVSAQQIYRSFSDIRVELERMQAERTILVQSARETISRILMRAKESQVVRAVDLDGNPLAHRVQVDFWVQGRLSQLIEYLENIQTELADEDNLPDNDTLNQWLQDNLNLFHYALEEIVLDARINALNSQLRINIADLVIQSLKDQGFSLAESDYETDDMRQMYSARLVNLEGNEVDVQVVPTGENLGENELHILSFDREERTEHELQRRWLEVSRSLSTYGLEVDAYIREDASQYTTQNGYAVQKKHLPSPAHRKKVLKP